jgi:3-oxoacyl-[acyl-carrier protein] reductase
MDGRVAIVTGGASGIGRATSGLLSAQGVEVVVFDRTGDPPVDVSHPASVDDAVASVRERYGRIDVLVNAAGTPAGGELGADGYADEWERSMAVNLTGTMLVTRACIPTSRRAVPVGSSTWRPPRRSGRAGGRAPTPRPSTGSSG